MRGDESAIYWGLRKYAGERELIWGGADGCEHEWGDRIRGNGDGGKKARARADEGVHEGWTEMTREVVESRNMRNVWAFATQPYSGAHFATFPEEIPRRCILAASKVGDFVLDPFAGSGTTGRVAIELNRRPILLDLAYHDHAEKRTRNVQRQLVAAE